MLGKYIYTVVRTNPRQKLRGLSTVNFNGLAAVISAAEYKDYNSLPKTEVVKELLRHQQIVEQIMRISETVLPVKFGTIVKDKKEVVAVLEKGYQLLRDGLREMEDLIELDLVCTWNEQKAARLAYKESKKVQKKQKKLAQKGDATLAEKIAVGKAVADFLITKKGKVGKDILKLLGREAVKDCQHVLGDVNMLLNQAFLIQKKNKNKFHQLLERLDRKFAGLVNFRLVGPLPPYSFATVVVDALDNAEVEKAKSQLGLINGEISKKIVKHTYNQLAKKIHPDHQGDSSKFEQITKSYKILRKYTEQGLIGVQLYKWQSC